MDLRNLQPPEEKGDPDGRKEGSSLITGRFNLHGDSIFCRNGYRISHIKQSKKIGSRNKG